MSDIVCLPLEEDVLWNIIENGQQHVLTVDVKQSIDNLNDNVLYYVSNAGLDVCFDWSKCDYQAKSKILLNYLQMNRMYYNDSLVQTLFDLMMCYKNIPNEPQGILNNEQCIDFINQNVELFEKLVAFLDSVMVLVGRGFKATSQMFDPKQYQQVNDPTISLNIVHLFKIPEFVAFYSVVNMDNLKWYVIQFEKPLYDDMLQNIVLGPTSGLAAAFYANIINSGIIPPQLNE